MIEVVDAVKHPAKGEKSARRTLKTLEFISRQRENVTAKRVACEIGISLPTAYNMINSLIQEGYVERVPGRKGYRLGPMISLLYRRSLDQGDLVSEVAPVIEELSERTGQRAYLALLKEGEVEVAEVKHAPGNPKMPQVTVGFRNAEHALAIGKALLANMPDEELEAYLSRSALEAFTSRTITDAHCLKTHLYQVRSQSFATDLEEFAEGFCCVAAPVRGATGEVEASVGISMLSRRFRAEAKSFARSILQAGQEASSIRGHRTKKA